MKKYASLEDTSILKIIARQCIVEQIYNRNQFRVYIANYTIFQSYNSVVAIYDTSTNDLFIFEEYINYSKTTSKHLYIYIREETGLEIYSLKDLNKAIKKGQITLIK